MLQSSAKRGLHLVLGILGTWAALANPAAALPAAPQVLPDQPSLATQVKIVCLEDGTCYRARGRRPVARWIYGDRAFDGPGSYAGPGYYGHPASHWRWVPFGF